MASVVEAKAKHGQRLLLGATNLTQAVAATQLASTSAGLAAHLERTESHRSATDP